MSFVVAAALAIGLLVGVPIAAHLLRRGRAQEQEFPPARLVPTSPPLARQQRRLEDRALLAIRGLLILLFALLGATPLVRCERLSVSRTAGASVAMALVLDDSLSMRAKLEDGDKWSHALAGARDLLGSAREGDAVALVLAGAPARLLLAATTDLAAARRALDDLTVSDRPTDLEGAVHLARSSLKQLPHADQRVVLLSDLAGKLPTGGEPPLWAPLEPLSQAMSDCGITHAERRGRRVTTTVACSDVAAARGRSVTLHARGAAPDADEPGEALAKLPLEARAGEQVLSAEVDVKVPEVQVRLSAGDAIAADDTLLALQDAAPRLVGVVADPARASVTTGGATLIEQALRALGGEVAVRPLPIVPEDLRDYAALTALVLDDPRGLSPESRSALGRWIERGGVALALLGPGTASAQLGSNLEPFVRGQVRWESTRAPGLEAASVGWLGAEGGGLTELNPRGRAQLSGAEFEQTRVLARWSDGAPFLLERSVGRGLVFTAALPVSVERSDVALRPGFLSLLDHVLEEAVQRSGARTALVGSPWIFPVGVPVEIAGPGGARLELEETPLAGLGERVRTATPARIGAYAVRVEGETQQRLALPDPLEITTMARDMKGAPLQSGGGRAEFVDTSRELGLIVLLLLLAELSMRVVRMVRHRSRSLSVTTHA